MAIKKIENILDTMEKRIKRLEATNKELVLEVERLRDIHEIFNMMNKYEWMLTGGLNEKVINLFAKKTPGVRADVGWGIYEGIEGIRRLYGQIHAPDQEDFQPGVGILQPGVMYQSLNTTPVIEISRDGKTAKAVWICPGHATMVVGGKLQAHWSWSKRATDFVKEDGEWKIWHYSVYGTFICPYDKSWVDMENPREALEAWAQMPKELKADRPSNYQWVYSPTATVEYVPTAPERYETFDDKTAY